jgi:hypothetical protein
VQSLWDKLTIGYFRAMYTFKSLKEVFDGAESDTLDFLYDDFKLLGGLAEKFFVPFYRGIFLAELSEQSSKMFQFLFIMFAQGATSVSSVMTLPLTVLSVSHATLVRHSLH